MCVLGLVAKRLYVGGCWMSMYMLDSVCAMDSMCVWDERVCVLGVLVCVLLCWEVFC